MKGPDCEAELEQARHAIETLGGTAELVRYQIPGTEIPRAVVRVEKRSATPAKYPRRWAKMQKTPI